MNYDALFHPASVTSLATCKICGQPRTKEGEGAHAAHHLATCEAITDTFKGVTRVIPTPAAKPESVRMSFTRKLDPALRKLLKKARRA